MRNYNHLPEIHWVNHDYCLYLHDLILSIFQECMMDGHIGLKFEENGRTSLKGFEKADDPIEWLELNGYQFEAKLALKRKMFHAILADFLNYILESLENSRKGKTAISFTLLRKPFKDNLFYLEWILYDGDELLDLVNENKIEKYEVGSMRKNKKGKMKTIITNAFEKNHYNDMLRVLSGDFFYELRYDYNAKFGLELMWNKANHLVTNAKTIRSRDFNNIFLTEKDYSDRWEYYYSKVPNLLLYSLGVVIKLYEELFEKISDESKTYNDLILLTKNLSRTHDDDGKKIINATLNEFPFHCENCNKDIFLNQNMTKEVQYKWWVTCSNCFEPISISKYHFIKVPEDN